MRQFKSRLRAGDTVSRATYEAGFGSSSRDLRASRRVARHDAGVVSPRRRGNAHRLHDRRRAGWSRARRDDRARRVRGGAGRDGRGRRACACAPISRTRRSSEATTITARGCARCSIAFENPRTQRRNRIPLDVDGTAFQWQVWKALQAIPAGERRTYSEIATAIGRPTAARAVARACATNRVAVVIPCHRVVRESGEISGYKWGVERKRQLLERETK